MMESATEELKKESPSLHEVTAKMLIDAFKGLTSVTEIYVANGVAIRLVACPLALGNLDPKTKMRTLTIPEPDGKEEVLRANGPKPLVEA